VFHTSAGECYYCRKDIFVQLAKMLPFVLPALYGAKAISTGLAALGLGATVLPPAIDFAKNYAKRGRTKGESGMSLFGGTDFTALPGGTNFETGMRPGDRDREMIEPEASSVEPSPIQVSDETRKLAFEKKAPGTTPQSLKDYYSAQKAVGALEKEGLTAAFGGEGSAMGQWAQANPDLALRLLQKREAKGMATVGGKAVPLEEEATVEMSPMERIKFIQGGFR